MNARKRFYDLTVWYKYHVSDGFFKEQYHHLTEDTMNTIIKRYDSEYLSGDYAALRVEYEIIEDFGI